jgi:multidrug efflux pump subunit AcrA (membrane-fusion protein)
MTAELRDPRSAIRKLNLVGYTGLVVALGGVGGWASTTNIAGAVIASGTVVVESAVKKVQHLSGGIVGEILVKEGSEVEAGQVLMRLDDTLTRATLGVVQSQLDLYTAREARLLAERDGLGRGCLFRPRRATRPRDRPPRMLSLEKSGCFGPAAKGARVNARNCASGSPN